MSAFHIFGANGQKIILQPPEVEPTVAKDLAQRRVSDLTKDDFDRLLAGHVQKRVRNRAVSIGSVADRVHGKVKPTPVNYDTLRQLRQRSELIGGIHTSIKNRVIGKQWAINLKDTDDPSGAAAEARRSFTNLLKHPMLGGSRPQSTHWQQWLSMWVEDLLTIDRACIEKEWNANSWPVALYVVDGATIRPNMDEQGGFYRDAYIQIVDGQKTAEFGMEDLSVAIFNPQSDVKLAGYGLSPLEQVVVSVTADLYAAKFNADYFQKGSVPEGILNLGEDVDPETVTAFTQYWLSEITGKPWTLPIIGGSTNPQFIDWRQSNRDMQFAEYCQWILQKACAVYGISKDDLGELGDVNRSTAEEQGDRQEDKSIQPLLDFIANTINLEILGPHGAGLEDFLEFEWQEVGENADQINSKFQPMHNAGVATGKEWRDAHGLADADPDAPGADGLNMHLAGGQPLPSHDDVAHMGAAAERQHSQEDQQQGFEREDSVADRAAAAGGDGGGGGGGGDRSGMPWKPADGDNPDVKAAMNDHDRRQGIGARHVSKTHPTGHDRHPALTASSDGLEQDFATATDRLLAGLAEIVGA